MEKVRANRVGTVVVGLLVKIRTDGVGGRGEGYQGPCTYSLILLLNLNWYVKVY